jgi:hypothetical protein
MAGISWVVSGIGLGTAAGISFFSQSPTLPLLLLAGCVWSGIGSGLAWVVKRHIWIREHISNPVGVFGQVLATINEEIEAW